MEKKKMCKHHTLLTVIFTIVSVLYVYPIILVVINSFKKKAYISKAPFALPDNKTFVGLENYVRGIKKTGLIPAFGWTVFITVLSVAVPFQMEMYTLSKIANMLHMDNPWGIIIIYLGFGAGLAVFMFTGFVKSIPLEIEEAAMIDGCTPIQTFFQVVMPIMKPTCITVSILQAMWIWNDYLLPSLVLNTKKYKTLSIAVQYLKGGYGSVDMGAMMGVLVISIIPIIVFYLLSQKYIIEGVVAGAVKG